MDDTDAHFRHWVGWGIAASARGLAAGKHPPHEGSNSLRPSPLRRPVPAGGGVHHYRFRVYALDANVAPSLTGSFPKATCSHSRTPAPTRSRGSGSAEEPEWARACAAPARPPSPAPRRLGRVSASSRSRGTAFGAGEGKGWRRSGAPFSACPSSVRGVSAGCRARGRRREPAAAAFAHLVGARPAPCLAPAPSASLDCRTASTSRPSPIWAFSLQLHPLPGTPYGRQTGAIGAAAGRPAGARAAGASF
jgi:hypothetical protein